MEVLSGAAEATNEFDIRVPVAVLVELWNLRLELKASVNLHFYNDEGLCLFVVNDFNNPAWKGGLGTEGSAGVFAGSQETSRPRGGSRLPPPSAAPIRYTCTLWSGTPWPSP